MTVNDKKFPDITKKEFVDSFIANYGAEPNLHPSAFFMAGLPGAGKTEFSKNVIALLGGSKAVRIDMDEIASLIKGYRPEEANKYRKTATKLLEAVLDKTLKKKMEFILDGTFGSKKSINNVKRAVNHGYTVKIVYIIQEPKLAWRFTQAREKVEHRSIDIDGFVETYFNILKNISEIGHLAKKHDKITLDIITQNESNMANSWFPNVKDDIDVLLKTSYNNKTLKEHLNDR